MKASVYACLAPAADVDGRHGFPVPVRAGILPPPPVAPVPVPAPAPTDSAPAAAALDMLARTLRALSYRAAWGCGAFGMEELTEFTISALRRATVASQALIALATVREDERLVRLAGDVSRGALSCDQLEAAAAELGHVADRPTDPGQPWICLAGPVETDPSFDDTAEARGR